MIIFYLFLQLVFIFVWIGILKLNADSSIDKDEFPSTNDDIRANRKKDFEDEVKSDRLNGEGVMPERTVHWPFAVVPFEVMKHETFGREFFEAFSDALKDLHQLTCVRFRPKFALDEFFIKIISGDGCRSYVGMQIGMRNEGQELSLGPDCWRKAIILHALMHVLGFDHEHSRYDTQLSYQNIQHRSYHFDMRQRENFNGTTRYGVNPILHYEPSIFAIDETLSEKDSVVRPDTGLPIRLSVLDPDKINRLYNCTGLHTVPKNSQSTESASDNRSRRIKQDLNAFIAELPYELLYPQHQRSTTWPSQEKVAKEAMNDAFKDEQDFFTRTGLKPAGHPVVGIQNSDRTGQLPLSFFMHHSINAASDEDTVRKQYSGNARFFEALTPSQQSINCDTPTQENCSDRRNDCIELALQGECDRSLRICIS